MSIERSWFQLGIRDLLTAAVIVALGILLYTERGKHTELRERYENLFLEPQLCLVHPTGKTLTGSFSVAGFLYHSDAVSFQQTPTLSVRLIDPCTQATVFESDNHLMTSCDHGHYFGYGYVFSSPPGIYVMTVEAYDGTELITRTTSAIEYSPSPSSDALYRQLLQKDLSKPSALLEEAHIKVLKAYLGPAE